MTGSSTRLDRRGGPRGRIRSLLPALALAALAGCSSANPANYGTFDQWTANDIEVYQLDKGAETRPQIYKMLYGPVLTPPLALYDAGLIIASPFVWTYYAAGGGAQENDGSGPAATVDAPPDAR